MTGLEEGLFLLSRSREDTACWRRNAGCSTGVTRAEDQLVITHARSRRRNGETLQNFFPDEIPPPARERATFRLWGSGSPRPPSAERRPGVLFERRAMPAFDEADMCRMRRVSSRANGVRQFGTGIAELSGVARETKVTVDFDDDESIGRKRLVVAFAGLGWDE